MSTRSDHNGTAPSALFTDLYELSMAQAYVADGLNEPASFEIFYRDPGPQRGYVLAGGLEAVLTALEGFALRSDELEYLAGTGLFSDAFIDWLRAVRFDGDIDAMPEGTAVFPNEPVLRVTAPLPVAQILETRVLNAVHYDSLILTKAARIVDAAGGRGVVDFGARRAHGFDASVAAARASWIAGCGGTSNMVAGQRYGLPVVGTMAHSYVEAFPDELSAFRAFARHYPETTLLVDTYDTLGGVENVLRLADELGSEFRVRAIRIDSGDLDRLSRAARERLDAAGHEGIRIIVSGGLGEQRIAELVEKGAPIDGFGVGTDLVVSRDAPTLDFAYKLVSYAGQPRLKASPDKISLPGAKQVFRRWSEGGFAGDTIAGSGEALAGEPLLQPVMRDGQRLDPPESLATMRERATKQRSALPRRLREPVPTGDPYPVTVSQALQRETERLRAAHRPSTADDKPGDDD
ncbi:nicotinate phosphoribosyltransferase [Halofilum ochraceum]|uniref:nicotinate phosphoribosyltransferase n=1 Tax=Halofilum ochraceum TaxID=1611323 RepID=UPI0009471484|nr:nicotinate phosphoribosyltransferase [Halofilum ochraceum]